MSIALPSDLSVVQGLRAGLVGEIVRAYSQYFVGELGWPPVYEALIAEQLGEVMQSADHEDLGVWSAWQGDEFLAAIVIDARPSLNEGARIRFFITSKALQGQGIGSRLLSHALEYCDGRGEPRVWLTSVAGLEAATHLFQKNGFHVIHERTDYQWGRVVREQRWQRLLPVSDSTISP